MGWRLGIPFLTEARKFTKTSTLAARPIQPPVQQAPTVYSSRVKRPWSMADHSPPSNIEVKNEWNSTPFLSVAFVPCIATNSHVPFSEFNYRTRILHYNLLGIFSSSPVSFHTLCFLSRQHVRLPPKTADTSTPLSAYLRSTSLRHG